jgi:uncharacterized protein DUF6226
VVESYRRPVVELPPFLDVEGWPIPYGQQWADRPGRMAPEDTYSLELHPERFAPLLPTADRLVEHLVRVYAVDVVAPTHPRPWQQGQPRAAPLRSVRLVPADPAAAALSVFWLPHPAVRVEAGVVLERTLPDCGCEACDETWDVSADALEELVFAVVEGRVTERVHRREGRPWTGWTIADAAGATRQGAGTEAGSVPRSVLREARRQLARVPGGWAAWSRRPGLSVR